MSILSGLFANSGDDALRAVANQADDIARIAAAQSDDLTRTVANNADDIFYHGTPNGGFQQFRDGSYFTKNKSYADSYQNPLASDISFGKKADNPMTYQVKLHNKKPFDISDGAARKIYIDDYIKGGNATGINPYQPQSFYDNIKDIDWTEVEGLKDFLIDNGYDYDSIIANEGGYFDDLGNVVPRGQSVLVFNGKDVEIMPETQSMLKKLLSGNATNKVDDSLSPELSESAKTIIDRYKKYNWTPDTENSLFEDIYNVVGDDVNGASNDIYNEILDHYGLKPVATPKGDDLFLVPNDAKFTGASGANDLFDEAAYYFSPNVETSRSWGKGDVPSRYIPFFDEQIRIANHNNSYSHPYNLIFDNDSLYKGQVTPQDVKNRILEEMRRAIDDGAAEYWLNNATSGKYGQTIEDAVKEMSDNFTDDFMKYDNGALSVMGEKPLRITPKTTSEDVSYYLYDALRNKKFVLAGLLGGGAILGGLLSGDQNNGTQPLI